MYMYKHVWSHIIIYKYIYRNLSTYNHTHLVCLQMFAHTCFSEQSDVSNIYHDFTKHMICVWTQFGITTLHSVDTIRYDHPSQRWSKIIVPRGKGMYSDHTEGG